YALGNVLVMIGGFVSFPIMTRLLDTGQYGIFGYYDAWLLILAGLFKLGAQHTILRFYPHTGGAPALARFGANFVLLPFLLSGALWLGALLVYGGIVAAAPPEAAPIGWIMLLLLLPTIWISYAGAFAYAEERSDVSVRILVGQRWAEVFSILLVVYFIERSTLGAYLARVFVATALACGLTFWLRRRLPMRWRDIELAAYFDGLRYGLPLVANEIASNLLSFADRLMLRQMLGNFADVGVYTIGYGLALNINNLFNFALYNAYTQVSIREYETKGPEAVLRTKREVLHLVVYVCAAMVAGLVCAGPDVLLLMAGGDKTTSVPVFVVTGIVYALDGLFGICGAGLLLLKRSRTVLALTLGSALFNVALNLVLIPRFGVMGAVWATTASFAALNVARYFMCPRNLRALPDLRAAVTATALAAVCIAVAHADALEAVRSHVLHFAMVAVLMLALFVAPAMLLDRRLREAAVHYWHSRRAVAA
ncbi:MAG TPA: oligosaccharide flippase family protein, partial [Rudaea sp.]|nr:oligosaccharide flippase family protein [Rudaea sp.]